MPFLKISAYQITFQVFHEEASFKLLKALGSYSTVQKANCSPIKKLMARNGQPSLLTGAGERDWRG